MQSTPAPSSPAQTPPGQSRRRSGTYVGAALLIGIGLVMLVTNLTGSSLIGESIPLAIGLAFLVAYVLTRQYGFAVPAGVLTGLGSGILASTLAGSTDNGTYVVGGLALGFLAIYGLDLLATRQAARWWPLVPGGILLLVAGGMATQNEGLLRQFGLWSPLLLVLIGVWILIARRGPARS